MLPHAINSTITTAQASSQGRTRVLHQLLVHGIYDGIERGCCQWDTFPEDAWRSWTFQPPSPWFQMEKL